MGARSRSRRGNRFNPNTRGTHVPRPRVILNRNSRPSGEVRPAAGAPDRPTRAGLRTSPFPFRYFRAISSKLMLSRSLTPLCALTALVLPHGFAQNVMVEDDRPALNGRQIQQGSGGSGTSSLASTGSDSCATPDPISGTGTFPFNSSAATTGSEGQSTVNCIFYNLIAINFDVWFVWTAPSTGRVQVSTCGGTTVDTKIAAYSGATCPPNGATALGCNDDIAGNIVPFNYQSWTEFDAVAGSQYMLQIGSYPGTGSAGGMGTFTISYVPAETCQHDDGTTENANSVGTQGTLRSTGWIHSIGDIGSATTVSTVSTIWGWTGTGSPLPAGLTGNVAVWEDPNDDGNPNDAVLLGSGSAPMVGQHTDAFQTIALSSSVTATGKFFIGAWVEHTTGFPAPRDVTGCGGRPFMGWLVGNAGGPLDMNNLTANSAPPFQTTNGNSYRFNLRANCSSGPVSAGTVFCEGSAANPTPGCPCANNSASGAGLGCLNSFGVGASLRGTGTPSISGDTVLLSAGNLPAASVLFFQGTTQQNGGAGSQFGDGLRCAGGTIIRLKTYTATGTPGAATSTYPQAGDPSVSVRGGVTTAGTRTYQAWYRNSAAFCTPSVFNLSNGFEIAWAP